MLIIEKKTAIFRMKKYNIDDRRQTINWVGSKSNQLKYSYLCTICLRRDLFEIATKWQYGNGDCIHFSICFISISRRSLLIGQLVTRKVKYLSYFQYHLLLLVRFASKQLNMPCDCAQRFSYSRKLKHWE